MHCLIITLSTFACSFYPKRKRWLLRNHNKRCTFKIKSVNTVFILFVNMDKSLATVKFRRHSGLPIWKQQPKVANYHWKVFCRNICSSRSCSILFITFFLKSIYEGVQSYKIYKHRTCNFTKNWLKKMIRD